MSPTHALQCLADFALASAETETLVVYDSVACLAMQIKAYELLRSAEACAEAIRKADAQQLEFRQLLEEGFKARSDDQGSGDGEKDHDGEHDGEHGH